MVPKGENFCLKKKNGQKINILKLRIKEYTFKETFLVVLSSQSNTSNSTYDNDGLENNLNSFIIKQ